MKRRARRVVVIAACCLGAGCAGDALLGAAPRADNAAIFDEVWRMFDLHYSYFGIKDVDWNASKARYRPEAIAAETDDGLAFVIGEMLNELRDVHVVLTPGAEIAPIRFTSEHEQRSTHFSAARVEGSYVDDARRTSGGYIRYGRLDERVGYVGIGSFAGRGWSREIDEALREIAADALVIDVRNNQGGDNGIAVEIAGRFADRQRTYGYVRLRNGPRHDAFTDFIPERVRPAGSRFRGPVVVLTNRRTMSAGEDFVLAMRSIPGVRVIGDTTGGASGGPIVRELPNGWTYQLSEWIAYTADRRPFEGVGLVPDIALSATAQDGDTDIVLETAHSLVATDLARGRNASGAVVR